MQLHAAALDDGAAFPAEDVERLRRIGALAAPIPVLKGGPGLATDGAAPAATLALLQSVGEGNLSVGRVLEAHMNAFALLSRYGGGPALDRAATDAASGHLHALWVTDPPNDPLRISGGGVLTGCKQFCSAAGHATRAVVTAVDEAGEARLVLAEVEAVSVTPLASGMQGMRAAITGQVRFNGTPGLPFGAPGDYLREPGLSTGAWRTCAVTLGGMEALTQAATTQLVSRGRDADPHQQARMGEVFIALDTARLWCRHAAEEAETADHDPARGIAAVNLARIAIEQACLTMITLVQRSLGVAAFLRPNPVERLCRDLGTYLRQPAADMVLTEAASYRMHA